ncbi:MAG: Rha family transcriptional regulator [Desulfotomaculum sp.]|nr:Rha family transcriptional regulator [Desulfotomaculum sp.]MCL0080939.1 Rha family transcriptional regulator [Peptococcaceae bacterium]
MKSRKLTTFGIEVKKKLLDLGLTQKEFCQQHHIPDPRLSEVLHDARLAKRYRVKIARILNIKLSE